MSDWINWPPTWATWWLLPALFVGFTVHELAHAVVAYLLGDTSQVEKNRLTFNPLRHVSWLGMGLFLLFGFAWAKPVWVDHNRIRLKNRAFGSFLVSISGAAANFLTALVAFGGVTLTVTIVWFVRDVSLGQIADYFMITEPGPDLQGAVIALTYNMVVVNVILGVFNLIPLPPLDGFQAAVSLVAAVRTALGRGPAQAEPAGREAADAGPSPAEIHFRIGLDYHHEGQLDEAIARYRQATDHDDRFALAYYNLGLAYWAKGRLPLAQSAFRAAMRARSDPTVALQSELRLRALLHAEQDPTFDPGPVPTPLEAPQAPEPALAAGRPLDPEMARRVWLRLAISGGLTLALALAAWVFVTIVTLGAVG
ncbi:MAG: tetratricopeptide repeat protein [Anaerolineae bacterium]|jgi:Zn-dependent protease